MKWINIALASALILITLCVLLLVKKGVGIRSAPYIKPTEITDSMATPAKHLLLRLFPDFQQVDVWLIEAKPSKPESITFIAELQKAFENRFNKKINWLNDNQTLTLKDIESCHTPCWIIFENLAPHTMEVTTPIHELVKSSNKKFQTLTWVYFDRQQTASDQCQNQQKLNFTCLVENSVSALHKKFRNENSRYFFLKKYLDNDYFLFIEKQKAP